jgi:hypothetical protein
MACFSDTFTDPFLSISHYFRHVSSIALNFFRQMTLNNFHQLQSIKTILKSINLLTCSYRNPAEHAVIHVVDTADQLSRAAFH